MLKHQTVIFDSQIKDNDTVYTIFIWFYWEPKGVQIEYASLVQFTEWMLELNKSGNKQQPTTSAIFHLIYL